MKFRSPEFQEILLRPMQEICFDILVPFSFSFQFLTRLAAVFAEEVGGFIFIRFGFLRINLKVL